MAGIYIHIPFCKQKCHYCDFYKTLETGKREDFIKSLVSEVEQRKNYLSPDTVIDTVYLGGGTPSVLTLAGIRKILKTLKNNFTFSDNPEITIEVNPDDITATYAAGLIKEGINRVSIGIQSFSDETLIMLNRRHDSKQALQSVLVCREAGFRNISIDLIYGIPGMSTGEWKKNLNQAFKLKVEHISAYHLTIEKNTMFGRMKDLGELKEIDEELSEEHFGALSEAVDNNSYIHYEISNIAREGYFSKHNTNYWRQVSYLGLGPSAHSYNGYSREWNVADIDNYINLAETGETVAQREHLDENTRYNEYVMTSLRTMWGVDLNYLESSFNKEMHDYLLNVAARFIKYGMLSKSEENNLVLTGQGKMISDNIISELMMV